MIIKKQKVRASDDDPHELLVVLHRLLVSLNHVFDFSEQTLPFVQKLISEPQERLRPDFERVVLRNLHEFLHHE